MAIAPETARERRSSPTEVRVHEVMSRQVVTVLEWESISSAVAKLVKMDVGSIVVMRDDRVTGIITKGDVLRKVVLKGLDPKNVDSREVMSQPVTTIEQSATVEEASKLMASKNISKLPVVDSGKLVGIITSSDIIRNEPSEVSYLHELIRARYVPRDLRT